jgi:hypothetical protein
MEKHVEYEVDFYGYLLINEKDLERKRAWTIARGGGMK